LTCEPAAAGGENGRVGFPLGGGELGALIRGFDWSATSLGPIASWPQSLKTAANIVLQSPLPLVMLWGSDGVMIYNDAYSVFAGQRHPRILGSKVLEGWPEVADFNRRVMATVLGGGTLSFKDQELTLFRHNRPEQVWMDLNYGPVLDESGRPGGVLAIVVETTGRVLAERRQAFLFEIGERLRELTDPRAIAAFVTSALGRQLAATRIGWGEVDIGTGAAQVTADWAAPGQASIVGRHQLREYGVDRLAVLESGRALRTEDVQTDPRVGDPALQAIYAGMNIRSSMTVPILRGGVLVAGIFIHCAEPRRWTDEEEALVREVAERTWNTLERVKAEARVRKSEARFRALVNATSDVVYRMSPDWTEMRRLDGRGFLADVETPSVTWMDDYLFPEDQPAILAAIQDAIARKGVFQLEHRVRRADGGIGWTSSRAVPVFDEAGGIIEWFGAASDITHRREAEAHLRLVVNELNHRVKNNLAMAQAMAAQTFRNADDLAQAQASFSARIMALAKANDLLTDEHWVDASLRVLIEAAVAPHCPDDPARCWIEGPDVRLSPKTALSLTMAFHELATNAVKHGAWSTPDGRVSATWTVEGGRLHLEWRESGGPPVRPPERRGFGSRLIERGLAAELDGEAKLGFEKEGLVCVIDAPLLRPSEGEVT
jgi:two-component sensor histidine kinase/PAS domain-containing protein